MKTRCIGKCKKEFKTRAAMVSHYRAGTCEHWRRTEGVGHWTVHFWKNRSGWTAERCFGGGWEGSEHERLPGQWANLTRARKAVKEMYNTQAVKK